jgi:hypothetical protein
VETLEWGLADNTVGRVIDGLLRADLLLVDELGCAPLDETGCQLLFRFVAAAYERRSLGVASHWPFEAWGRFLPIPSTATSLLDRLLHHAVIVITAGESFRMKEARRRAGGPSRGSGAARRAAGGAASGPVAERWRDDRLSALCAPVHAGGPAALLRGGLPAGGLARPATAAGAGAAGTGTAPPDGVRVSVLRRPLARCAALRGLRRVLPAGRAGWAVPALR